MNDTANGDRIFYFVGNLPCLDFVNTEIVSRGEPVDLLTGFADFVRWLQAATLVTPAQARMVEKRWGDTSEGRATFSEAVSLRAALRKTAERLAAGKVADRIAVD